MYIYIHTYIYTYIYIYIYILIIYLLCLAERLEILFKSQQICRSELHNVFTEKVNNVVLNDNGDKRIQTGGGIIAYPYGIDPEIV